MDDKVQLREELDMDAEVQQIREKEYPTLKDEVYLDHAGTTPYAKSLIERFSADLLATLYGNPHSASAASQAATARIEDTRLRVLHFFNADPAAFDVLFVANATAGIKFVADALRCAPDGFAYSYHRDAHTSLVGVREAAVASCCFDDAGLEGLLARPPRAETELFAYPAQSNMDGRRLPLGWARRMRETGARRYVLLDAAALAATAPLDLGDADGAPDFTAVSFSKIFGFPDLGALIVRREAGAALQQRRYFGGGTVENVVCGREQWHVFKEASLHESLEDGTLPVHSIVALDSAMAVHKELYGSMERVAAHTLHLALKLYAGLRELRHANGREVCRLYSTSFDAHAQGPIVAFNLVASDGTWVSNGEFEKLAAVRRIHIRTGGVCNPGGVAAALDLAPWEVRRNFSAGVRCGGETDVVAGKPAGIIRASMGAMSTSRDVERFLAFVGEFYVERAEARAAPAVRPAAPASLYVEALTIYPIKSCGGASIPPGVAWEVRPEGLAWDREWCLVHEGTSQALSQKRHTRMALLRPSIDFAAGVLRVRYAEREVRVPLSGDPALYAERERRGARVCGDEVQMLRYASGEVNGFFTEILGVPCALARFPAGGGGASGRHAKAHMQRPSSPAPALAVPGAFPGAAPLAAEAPAPMPLLLSNESPMLLINRASLAALNAEIRQRGGKEAAPAVFRANILVGAEDARATAYAESGWRGLRIGGQSFEVLGPCRRCHMICVDQETGEKDEEPFVTLARTRRERGKVFFGAHMCLGGGQYATVRVGDAVAVE